MQQQIPQTVPSKVMARTVLALAGLAALAIFILPSYVNNDAQPMAGEWFVDSDTYMRLVRVQDWWQGLSTANGWLDGWYNSVSPRSNWPHGEVLHWTRPLDMLLIVLAAPFWPFFGFHKALFIAGVIVSPVLSVFAMWALVRGTRSLLDLRGHAILLVLFAVQPITRFYFLVARPDHHALILLAFVITLSFLLRYAHDPDGEARAPAWAGLAAAFGIWVSVESLTTELFALSALGLPWLLTGDARWLAGLRRFAIAGVIALAVMMGVEQSPHMWLSSEEFDRLSTVHVTLLALIALGVELMWRARRHSATQAKGRFAMAALAAIGAGVVMAGLFPAFFKGPFGAAMDPRLAELWLGKVKELKPLLAADWDTITTAPLIVGPTVWLALWAWQRHKEQRATTQFDETILILVLAGVLYLPLTLFQVRWGAYLGVGTAIAWAAVLQRTLNWRGGPLVGPPPGTPILRTPMFALVLMAHILVAGVLILVRPDAPPPKEQACNWRLVQPLMMSEAFGGGTPQTVLSFIHQGPEIMYRTPHRVIGTPYHRNTQGILDNYNALATTDMAMTRNILQRRNVDFVVLCVDSAEERHFLVPEGETLMRKIAANAAPNWLQKMPLPAGLEEHFRIFRFVPGQN